MIWLHWAAQYHSPATTVTWYQHVVVDYRPVEGHHPVAAYARPDPPYYMSSSGMLGQAAALIWWVYITHDMMLCMDNKWHATSHLKLPSLAM